ncbi:polysaccharide deacetylase family protein [Streptomyces sp. NBC_00285]|uniref:polysaccharide deacetylase family protein n=1 Tax=Streptomyces sp. NBC_00285 TaxID=2975700 RepID=UPI002E29CBF3|nr:polysaccharide deacetylase family protein [Streptomyces sp. NBC_00285]
MGTVGQNYKNGAFLVAIRGGLVLLAAAALVSGCARPDGTDARRQQPLQAPPAPAADLQADKMRIQTAKWRAEQARTAVARRWGLKSAPLTAPPAPAQKPHITTRHGFEVDGHEEQGLPPVFTTIPTRQKIVFLTIDDGAEKDPAFLRMMSELKIPYTAFLSDYLVKDDYGYFRKMRDAGVVLNNHTLHHPYLPALSYARQKHEICGMQDVVEKQYGTRPALFRPPYGNYNEDTLRAAKSCGVRYAPIWNEEVYVDHWEYREDDQKIHPGDIVLSHFRGREDWKGTMPDMVRRFLDKVTAEGYAVARIEDYL